MKTVYNVKAYVCDESEESEEILYQRLFTNKDAAKNHLQRVKEKLLELDEVREAIEETIPERIDEGYDAEYVIDRPGFYGVLGCDGICYNVTIDEIDLHDEDNNLPIMLQFNY